MNPTLKYEDGKSSKFYTLSVDANVLTINFGRIGSAGQTQVKKLKNDSEAQKLYQALVSEKRKKGYVEDGSAPAAAATPAAAASPSAPVAASGATAKNVAKPTGKNVVKAAPSAAVSKAASVLPAPALEDPPVPGLDLVIWR